MTRRERILLVDQHPDWIKFAEEVLSERYDVVTATSLEDASQCCRGKFFDLIFVGLHQAENKPDILNQLNQTPQGHRRLVIMFPVSQDYETMRRVFKAGAYDCVDKPYSREALLEMVEEEIAIKRNDVLSFTNSPPRTPKPAMVLV